MVEREIIPRLVSAHPSAQGRADAVAREAVPERDPVRMFVGVLLSRSPETVGRFVEERRASGLGPESLYAGLLAPAARRLAELWDEDEISFTEVTIGLGRLQHVARGLECETIYNGDNDPDARSALFSPRPGEQQTFGFYLIEELFRWSGWRTWIETAASDTDIVANVRCRWYDMFCLSVSRATAIEDLVTTIGAVRRASRNPDLFVLVNGRPFDESPALVATVGADQAASCAREALQAADEALWRPTAA
jgi:methanogenic corrinoid protein MtbC1